MDKNFIWLVILDFKFLKLIFETRRSSSMEEHYFRRVGMWVRFPPSAPELNFPIFAREPSGFFLPVPQSGVGTGFCQEFLIK